MKKKLDAKTITLILLVITAAGLIMRFYPTFADWWNSFHQSRAVAAYASAINNLDEHQYDEVFQAAEEYNMRLKESGVLWNMSEEQKADYYAQLDVTGLGVMAYIDIPKIGITLPIYHGTSDTVLQVGIGHLEGTSLPVGGEGSHCSVSGHRGLPSARLFTDLGQLQEGDRFTITVLDQTMTYEVDQIRIVLPNELEELAIDPAADYVTLVTCTPYGVNSHRMLVRGKRVENDPDEVIVLSEAVLIEPRIFAFGISIPMFLILYIWMMVSTGKEIQYKKDKRLAQEEIHQRMEHRSEIAEGKMNAEEQKGETE